MQKSKTIYKILSFILCALLIFEQSGFAQVAGQIDIAGHLLSLRQSLTTDKFRPLHLRYLSYDPVQNNFRLLLDKGSVKQVSNQDIENTSKDLLKYFLIGVTLPNESFWVNLRPDSPDDVIDPLLAQTDVGKILLESDVQLKKDTARATSPDTADGKEYWDKLYKKAEELFGTQNVTIPTLTRPWIVPDEIIIRETADNAYIYKATLKVMLEEDYLGSTKSQGYKGTGIYNFDDERLKEMNKYATEIIKEKILPKITKEVNTSKKYAGLRQVYYSLILAQWFKQRFYGRGGLYSSLINKSNLNGLLSRGEWSKNQYFKEYQKSFKDGEYNFKTPVQTIQGQTIRSYFSGGASFAACTPRLGPVDEQGMLPLPSGGTYMDINGKSDRMHLNPGNNPDNIGVEIDGSGQARVAILPEDNYSAPAEPVPGEQNQQGRIDKAQPVTKERALEIGNKILKLAQEIDPGLEAELAIEENNNRNAWAHSKDETAQDGTHKKVTVNTGVLESASFSPEDMVAGVWAHEIAHRMMVANDWFVSEGGLAQEWFSRKARERKAISDYTLYLQKSLELDCDRVAVLLLLKAGYSPGGVTEFHETGLKNDLQSKWLLVRAFNYADYLIEKFKISAKIFISSIFGQDITTISVSEGEIISWSHPAPLFRVEVLKRYVNKVSGFSHEERENELQRIIRRNQEQRVKFERTSAPVSASSLAAPASGAQGDVATIDVNIADDGSLEGHDVVKSTIKRAIERIAIKQAEIKAAREGWSQARLNDEKDAIQRKLRNGEDIALEIDGVDVFEEDGAKVIVVEAQSLDGKKQKGHVGVARNVIYLTRGAFTRSMVGSSNYLDHETMELKLWRQWADENGVSYDEARRIGGEDVAKEIHRKANEIASVDPVDEIIPDYNYFVAPRDFIREEPAYNIPNVEMMN